MSRPYASNLGINKSWLKQSKALEKSVNNALKPWLFSVAPLFQASVTSNFEFHNPF